MRALLVGRFQPFHKGHLQVIRDVAEQYDRVIIGIGSADQSHSLDNPFTAGERHLMISASLEAEGILNYYLVPIMDMNRAAVWVSHVESLVPPFDRVYSNNPLTRRLFQESGYTIEGQPLYDRHMFSGKMVRTRMIEGSNWEELVPDSVISVMKEIGGISRIQELSGTDTVPPH